ncbi:MAG: PAS domain S-box protein [Anaerolineae bacterium]
MSHPETILIVDDDDGICRTLSLVLNKKGYQTETAASGEEALAKASRTPFNLAILDIKLPDTKGVELIAPLQRLQPDIIIIMATAHASVETAIQALNDGASAYITKPLNLDQTLAILKNALEKQRLVIENERLLKTVQQELADRQQAEKDLQKSEARFRKLAQTATDAIITIDGEGRIRFFNRAAGRIFGHDPQEISGQSVSILMPQKYKERHQKGIKRYLKTGQPKIIGATVEMEGLRKGGDRFPLELSLSEVRVEGEITFTGIIRDITERVRAAAEIARRNRELTLLNRVIAASAAHLDPESILNVACRELAQAFDVPQVAASLLNEEATEAVVAAEHLSNPELSARGMAFPTQGNPSFEYLMEHKRPLVVENAQTDPHMEPLHDVMRQRGIVSLLILPLSIEGEVIGSLGLTALKARHFSQPEIDLAWRVAEQVSGALARARLTRLHRRLITAIEQTAESVIITDTRGTILFVNPAFERTSGYSRAEALGQNPRLLKSGHHDREFYRELWDTIKSGQVWHGRFINQKKGGDLYTEEATISPVRDEAGDIVNFVGVQRDVTRELQLEEQFRQAQKMEALGQLTGGIAHDFNNLLTAINGFAELLQMRLPADSADQKLLGHIIKSGRSAADLVAQLLAFSRKTIIEPKVLDMNSVVAGMEKMLRRIIGETLELKTSLAPDVWPVRLDPAQVEQVIVNLSVNARDAMPDGGRLTIETANVLLSEAYAAGQLEVEPGQYVLLTVSDTGTGMTEEVLEHIFEPFFTTKEQGAGTGLGLATVFGIVKQNRGHITVQSRPGWGSVFRIYLPRAEDSLAELDRENWEPSMPTGSEVILLAEDEAAVRELAAYTLRRQGYTVLEAADGQEGLQLALEYTGEIDLLLTDVVMPKLGGKALADQLQTVRPGTRVLFASGYTADAIDNQGVLNEGVAFIQKPFSPAALAQKVRQILDSPGPASPPR